MGRLTIGQVAERTGFTASALRYYEAHGVLKPVDRTEAGYRLYDDTSVERLRFVARAKELGCSLEDIAELAELWAGADCAPAQSRLHELVTDKIAEARRRSAELVRFTAQLQSAATHLGVDAADGPCSPECACFGGSATTAPVPVVLGEHSDFPVACTLSPDDIPARTDEWARLLDHVVAREPLPTAETGIRLVLSPAAPVAELVRLVTAEQSCCSFFAFAITVDERGVALEVRAPVDAREVVDALFGTPT